MQFYWKQITLTIFLIVTTGSLFSTLYKPQEGDIPQQLLHKLEKNFEAINRKYFEIAQLLKQQKEWNVNLTKRLDQQKDWKEYYDHKEKVKRHLIGKNPKVIRKSNPHILLDNVQIDCNANYKLLVLVSTASSHFERRNIIRKSWGNSSIWSMTKESPMKVIFVVGSVDNALQTERILNESNTYRDIMSEDILEHYFKLSFKVMIGFQWVSDSFRFDFVMKTDDDIFVQIDRVMQRLKNDFANEHYIGHVMYGQSVRREVVSKEDHPKDTHDPYCSGGSFLISYEAIRKIIPLFNWKNPLIIDDAYIGKLVFDAGIKAYHVPNGFYMWNNWCEYNPHLLVSHPVKIKKCMDFFMAHSLIENGKMRNDTIKNQKYGNKEI